MHKSKYYNFFNFHARDYNLIQALVERLKSRKYLKF
jgi:hypothetical protein